MNNILFFESEDFDPQEFLSLFSSIYTHFYDHFTGRESIYNSLIEQGDAMLHSKTLKPFIASLIKQQGDIFSSDRECAALAATFNIYAASDFLHGLTI